MVEGIGQIMTFWILPRSCRPLHRSSVIPFLLTDYAVDPVKRLKHDYIQEVEGRIGEYHKALTYCRITVSLQDPYSNTFLDNSEDPTSIESSVLSWENENQTTPHESVSGELGA